MHRIVPDHVRPAHRQPHGDGRAFRRGIVVEFWAPGPWGLAAGFAADDNWASPLSASAL